MVRQEIMEARSGQCLWIWGGRDGYGISFGDFRRIRHRIKGRESPGLRCIRHRIKGREESNVTLRCCFRTGQV